MLSPELSEELDSGKLADDELLDSKLLDELLELLEELELLEFSLLEDMGPTSLLDRRGLAAGRAAGFRLDVFVAFLRTGFLAAFFFAICSKRPHQSQAWPKTATSQQRLRCSGTATLQKRPQTIYR